MLGDYTARLGFISTNHTGRRHGGRTIAYSNRALFPSPRVPGEREDAGVRLPWLPRLFLLREWGYLDVMPSPVTDAGTRFHVLVTRALRRMGFSGNGFVLFMAVLIGVLTAAAAVGFHELILNIRALLYSR